MSVESWQDQTKCIHSDKSYRGQRNTLMVEALNDPNMCRTTKVLKVSMYQLMPERYTVHNAASLHIIVKNSIIIRKIS